MTDPVGRCEREHRLQAVIANGYGKYPNKILFMTHAILVAAGDGRRAGRPLKKQFVPIAGKPVFIHALMAFETSARIDTIVCVIAKSDRPYFEDLIRQYPISKIKGIVDGGAHRQDSVLSGVSFLEQRFAA
ncbi:MAG: 2-C-methyl-D-erythritol 4-phosphate cytidylyltransferase, partial [Nitrospirota bacterium]